MKHPISLTLLVVVALAATTAVAQSSTKSRSTPGGSTARSAVKLAGDAPPAAKKIQYSDGDVPHLHTKVRFTTLIVLPKGEEILDFVVGDPGLWVVQGDQNFAYVKPAKENSQTNLNLITASGNTYSFWLDEVTGASDPPDLKVFVELRDPGMTEAASGPRRFVPASEIDNCRQQTEAAKHEAQQVKDKSQAAIDAGINQFLHNLRFAYRFEAGKKPFYIRSMAHDDRSTYIQARPEEVPALYEMKDGHPSLVNFTYADGLYVVDKVLDSGYLVVGKKRLKFYREE